MEGRSAPLRFGRRQNRSPELDMDKQFIWTDGLGVLSSNGGERKREGGKEETVHATSYKFLNHEESH